jgi:arylsulfatase A-like enzyme
MCSSPLFRFQLKHSLTIFVVLLLSLLAGYVSAREKKAGVVAEVTSNLFWRYGEQMAVRQGDWKLVRALDTRAKPPALNTGLYDLANDISEEHDLSAAQPDKVKELKSLWDEWNKQNVPALWSGNSGEDEPAAAGKKSKD